MHQVTAHHAASAAVMPAIAMSHAASPPDLAPIADTATESGAGTCDAETSTVELKQ